MRGRPRTLKDIRCKKCNKFFRPKSSKTKYCGSDCFLSNGIARRNGKVYKCPYCGKQLYRRPGFKFKTAFCNRKHMIAFMKKTSFRLVCVICGKIFFCQPCQVKYRNRKTCSIACRDIARSKDAEKKQVSGFYTKHQIARNLRYSKKCDDWRKQVFKRDNYTCKSCGSRGGYLEAHHIKPFAYFPKLRYELSNGQTLCRKCHDKTKIGYKKLKEKYAKV